MPSEDASQKMIVLKSSDGETFEVEEMVAQESQVIKHMIEDNCADTTIPLPNVTSRILAKVIEYCKKHVEAASKATADRGMCSSDKVVDDKLKAFDTEFFKVDLGTLIYLFMAANYLHIKSLTFKAFDNMRRRTASRKFRLGFNIKDFISQEEEDKKKKEKEEEEERLRAHIFF